MKCMFQMYATMEGTPFYNVTHFKLKGSPFYLLKYQRLCHVIVTSIYYNITKSQNDGIRTSYTFRTQHRIISHREKSRIELRRAKTEQSKNRAESTVFELCMVDVCGTQTYAHAV